MLDTGTHTEPEGREAIEPGDEVLRGGVSEGHSDSLQQIPLLQVLCGGEERGGINSRVVSVCPCVWVFSIW